MRAALMSILACAALACAQFLETPRVVPTIIDSIPHDQNHFTQGLFFDGEHIVESTGQYGQSGIYRYTLGGTVLDSAKLSQKYFGEGSVAVGENIYYLTWRENKAFVYSRKPFKKKSEFYIPTEGWGLTFWRDALLMSNGSSQLLQIALGGYSIVGTINVTDNGRPVKMLNELEMVGNTLLANIWQTPYIAVIELPSGRVKKYFDLSGKDAELRRQFPDMDVLNGIAYDGKHLWITGKNWPYIYKLSSDDSKGL